MARLIDADALNKELQKRVGSPTDDKLYEVNLCIIAAPTVPAIPVEWLENKLNTLWFEAMGAAALYGDRIGELAKSINEVMKLWQKEQEAR